MFATRPSAYQILRHDARKFPRLSYRPTLYGDNGVDPILGPPYPPVNYQLYIHQSTQPRLTWTVPDLIIDLEVVSDSANTYRITAKNQEWLDWASGTTYIKNSRVLYNNVRYNSLIDDNSGNQPDASPLEWEEDATVFQLHIKQTISGGINIVDDDFVEVGYSHDDEEFTQNILSVRYGWTVAIVYEDSAPGHETEILTNIVWYMTATNGGTTISSQLVETSDTFYMAP